jgi:hypothetical protein
MGYLANHPHPRISCPPRGETHIYASPTEKMDANKRIAVASRALDALAAGIAPEVGLPPAALPVVVPAGAVATSRRFGHTGASNMEP